MRLTNAGAGQAAVLAGAAILSLSGCGSKPAPLPPTSVDAAPSSNVLAFSGRDTLVAARFENAARQANVPATGAGAQTLTFWDEYVRYSLESQAAVDAGLTRDSLQQRRWASIRERILADRYSQEIVQGQFGYTDRQVDSVIAKDTALRKLAQDTARVHAARKMALVGVKYDSLYKASSIMFRRADSSMLPLDSAKPRLEQMVLGSKTQRAMSGLADQLRSDFKVELTKAERPAVSKDTLEAFYKKNRDRWTNTPLYVLSALGAKDSTALKAAVLGKKKPATKEAFQALSAKFPVGAPIAPKGELGRVKRNFALPYGVGMMPELFTALDTAKPGVVGLVHGDSLWYAFWYEKRDSATVKPFDQVVEDVRSQYLAENPWTPPAAAVVARWDRGVLYTKADVDFIAEEVPAQMKRQFPFERVLDFMLRWKVTARAAAESGLLARPSVQAVLRDNESVYWSQAWRKSRDAAAFFLSDSAMKTAWKDNAKLFPAGRIEDSAQGVNRDAARLAVMPAGFLKERYALRLDSWMQDSVLPSYDSVAGRIFRESRADLELLGRARMDSVLKARYNFKSFPSAPHAQIFRSLSEMFDSARTAYDRRDLETAELLYSRIEKDYPKGDTLFDKALFQMGQLQGEKQNYTASLEAYRKLLLLRPKSPEAYKAQFMIAFTYSEYLKKEKLALAEYRKVLVNYPTCELAKDADWMIRNIESGGALMPKFDDSVAVLDTAKAAAKPAAKDTAAKAVAPKATAKPVVKDAGTKPAAVKVEAAPAVKTEAKPAAAKVESKPAARTIGRVPVKVVGSDASKSKVDTTGSKAK